MLLHCFQYQLLEILNMEVLQAFLYWDKYNYQQ